MIVRLFRIVALWWRSRRWVACSECGVTLTPDERAHWKEHGVALCEDCREIVPPVPALPEFRPGMVIPIPRRADVFTLNEIQRSYLSALQAQQTYSSPHDFRTTYFE